MNFIPRVKENKPMEHTIPLRTPLEETKVLSHKKPKHDLKLRTNSQSKVRIDNIHDLIKLSFTEIKNLNVNELQGELFEKVFEETVKPKIKEETKKKEKETKSLITEEPKSEIRQRLKYVTPSTQS